MSFESRQTNCNLLFQKLNILNFFDLVQTQNIIFLHKLLNGNIPSELQETFKLLTIEFFHDTRNKNYLTFTVHSAVVGHLNLIKISNKLKFGQDIPNGVMFHQKKSPMNRTPGMSEIWSKFKMAANFQCRQFLSGNSSFCR